LQTVDWRLDFVESSLRPWSCWQLHLEFAAMEVTLVMNATESPQLQAQAAREMQIRKRVKREAEFWQHAMAYAIVNALAVVAAAVLVLKTGKTSYWWMSAPMAFGWGIGLGVHALTTFARIAAFGSDWEERKVQELLKEKR
jgi:uncharacterized membrane protein YgdD (TMEM256/DUF423 family)